LTTQAIWLSPLWAFSLAILASWPLGLAMARMLDVGDDRTGHGLDRPVMWLVRLLGRRTPARMDWRRYAVAMLAFNAALFVAGFTILAAQHRMPLNPDGKGSLASGGPSGADTGVIFNTTVSFVTNCSLQHYAGERQLSHASQLGAITWLDLVSAATGLACLLAVARGLRGDEHMGDFYVDVIRSLVLVLVPLSVVVTLALVACGVPMTFEGVATSQDLEGGTRLIARGPVAALVAAKQLMTVGGGFFGTNSAHPLENPSPWSNLLEVVAIAVVPMASIVLLGRMLGDRAHGRVVYGVMLAFAIAGAMLALGFEAGSRTTDPSIAAGPNLEGKEIRLGAASSATWAAITTATSNGSVNAMHGSFRPLGGLVPLGLMLVDASFGGIGSGYAHFLLYVIMAVFLGGLMVGRTPEYLGRKVEAREVKLAMLGLLLHPLVVCVGVAVFAAMGPSRAGVSEPGPHGFTEILYEFASSFATNGSGFEALADDTPAWNVATGLAMLLGRYPALIFPLAIAGSLSSKVRLPRTQGTLRTDTWTFAILLAGTILLVGALSFLPAVALGPIAEHLMP
jgi:K+-transporting ATPase ATPase A chain